MLTLNQKISRIDSDIVSLFEFRPEGNGIIETTADAFIQLDTSINQVRVKVGDYQLRLSATSDASMGHLQVNQLEASNLFLNTFDLDDRFTDLSNSLDHLERSKQSVLEPTNDITLNTLNVSSIGIGDIDVVDKWAQADMSLSTLAQNVNATQTDLSNTNVTANSLDLVADLWVGGQMTAGTLQISERIQSTMSNGVIVSSQLNVSNQGFGPALKVSQHSGNVALFHAGSEGDAMLIDASGEITVYKDLNLVGNFIVKEKDVNLILESSFNLTDALDASMVVTRQHISASFSTVSGQIDVVDQSLNHLFETKQESITSTMNLEVKNVIVKDLRVNGDFLLDGSFNIKGPPGEIGPVGSIGPAGASGRPLLPIHEFTGFQERTVSYFVARDDPRWQSTYNNFWEWYGGVLAPNGKIYGMPHYSSKVLVIDPLTRTTSFITAQSGYLGGVLARNGKIYGIPNGSNNVLVIDPDTHDISFIPLGRGGWAGGVLIPNGKIYGVPQGSTDFLVIDPETHDISFIPIGRQGDYVGGVLGPNGKIYCIPGGWSRHALVFNPATNHRKFIENMPGNNRERRWSGGVLAPNGKIYGIPYSNNNVIIFDTKTDTVSFVDVRDTAGVQNSLEWSGGVLAPDGKIYFIPNHSSRILVFDPTNHTFDRSYTLSGAPNKWHGGVLAPNGKIYGIPQHSNNAVEFSTGQPVHPPWMLQAYFNKF